MLLLLSRFSSVRLCDPIKGSPLGSSVPGIFRARVLEWGAIAFSNTLFTEVPYFKHFRNIVRELHETVVIVKIDNDLKM